MSSSKGLFFLCVAFIVGIFLELLLKIPQIFVWGILISGITLIFLSFLVKRVSPVIGFCLLILVAGILRAQISEFDIANDKLAKFNDKGQIILEGVISNEPDVRDAFQKIKVKAGNSVILITTNRYPEYKYLDKIKITGKLEMPMVSEDFNYKNYLLKDHIYSVMAFPKISALGRPASGGELNAWERIYSLILLFKGKIRQSINQNFSPPQSSILEGTILGDNGAMTNDLKDKLNITGLRHVIAVSGTHVVILGAIIMSLLLVLGFWRGQAFYFAIFFICVYIVLTGLPSSGIRAGIMGGIFLYSQKIGRQASAQRLVAIACAVMLLINPLLLIYDVGFQLSFLAVLGLIYLEPFIKMMIKKITKERAKNLVTIVSTTFAAQIFTLPIMVYNFGNVSLVAPITNLLVLPIVSLLMIFGFLASIMGAFSIALGWILSVPCMFLLNYFVFIINFFSKPWMIRTFENVSWIFVLASYFIIAVLAKFLQKRYSQFYI